MKNNYEKNINFIMLLIFFFSLGFSLDTFTNVQTTMASSEVIKWGVSFKEDNSIPEPNLSKEELKKYNAFYYDEFNDKNLYLTFDAGFENGNTIEILNILEKHNVTAIFFLVSDYINQSPEMVQLIYDMGHIIGNHTHTHPNMYEKTKEEFEKEILNMEETLLAKTGITINEKYYRPPQGRFTKENLEWTNDLGYKTLLWSVAYVDWEVDNQPSYEDALNTLFDKVHDGAIILLHPQSTTNTAILDEFITTLTKGGYQFAHPNEIS